MRVIAAWILALGLVAVPAMAGTGGAGDGKDAAKSNDASAAKDSSGNTSAASSSTDPAAKPAPANLVDEIQQLRDLIEAQSRQLQAQTEQLKQQQQKMQSMQQQLTTVNAAVASGGGLVNEGADPALAINPASSSALNYAASRDEKKDDSPVAIHFKGITLTPGGFIAAESVFRNRALSADVNTPFNSVPYPFSDLSKISENNFSGRQSRITLLAEGKLDNVKLSGYYETDWLGSGTTSNNNQTNSYVNRQRQIWGQAAFENGFTVTGGQMWSLVTETKHGLDNRTEGNPLTVDAQYQVGFTWARQYGIRVTKNFGDRFWLGLSVEDSQDNSVTVHASPGQTVPNIFFALAPGNNGGLFNTGNNYSFNASPDFVVKAAWEPGWGHYEIWGLVGTFRDRVYPCLFGISVANPCADGTTVNSTNLANNQVKTIGSVGGNIRLPLLNHKLDAILHAAWGDGIGRYGSGGLPDSTVRFDGSVEPIRDGMAMAGFEWHPTPKWDIYAYGGAEYAARTWYFFNFANGVGQIGYGAPFMPGVTGATGFADSACFAEVGPTAGGLATSSTGNCTGDTRYLAEGTIGFWNRIWSGPKGRMQWGLQYSYVTRSAWSGCTTIVAGTSGAPSSCGASSTDPHGPENMFFTSFRYYFP